MPKHDLEIRPVDSSNVEDFIGLIVSLAEFEKLTPPDEAAKERLRRHALHEKMFHAGVAYAEGKPAAYITYYFTYSTFLAKPTFFLEDIFVLEEYRRRGLGRKLFHYCRAVADKEGCGRMEWAVLDWNQDAIQFYEGLGGAQQPWYFYRIVL